MTIDRLHPIPLRLARWRPMPRYRCAAEKICKYRHLLRTSKGSAVEMRWPGPREGDERLALLWPSSPLYVAGITMLVRFRQLLPRARIGNTPSTHGAYDGLLTRWAGIALAQNTRDCRSKAQSVRQARLYGVPMPFESLEAARVEKGSRGEPRVLAL